MPPFRCEKDVQRDVQTVSGAREMCKQCEWPLYAIFRSEREVRTVNTLLRLSDCLLIYSVACMSGHEKKEEREKRTQQIRDFYIRFLIVAINTIVGYKK